MTGDHNDIVERMLNDRDFRTNIVRESHFWFLYFYFPHFIKYQMAPFHEEMFALTENESVRTAVIVAFRDSAKSTIFTFSFPIWAILGKQQIKHILILSGTHQKAQRILHDIKLAFEQNHLLRSDLGPFKEERNEWNMTALYLPKYKAKISIGSVEQSIRGIRFGEHRPQLILLDDIEDLESVKTKESRDKIDNWLMGEVIPAGDITTRLIVVGNLLHNDAVMMRLKKRIEEKRMYGEYREFPFFTKDGMPSWPGKFPNQAAVDAERMKGLSEVAWRREYLLEIIPEEDQVVRQEWIKYYDALPELASYADYRFAVTGVDLAISEKETADFTAAVSAQVFGHGKDRRIYILPQILNERLSSPSAVERVSAISRALGNGVPTSVYVEDVGYQKAFTQYLKEKDIPADGVKVAGHDKRSRLQLAATLIQSGAVMFPKQGCEALLTQMLGFGVERHDDIVDAFTLIIMKLIADDGEMGRILIPSNDALPKPSDDTAQDADEELRLLQEAQRSGDPYLYRKHQAKVNERRAKQWNDEARYWYNRRRRYF